ncbi:hypothetical protein ACF0H5_012051 [Mactra antiquata]
MRLIISVVVIFALFIAGSWSIPPPVPDFGENEVEFTETDGDDDSAYILRVLRGNQYKRLSLKSRYVCQNGAIMSSDSCGGCGRIKVDATYAVSDYALQIGATIASKMTRNMMSEVFCRLASQATIGIFTKSQTLTVYPEYYSYTNPSGCGSSCAGYCAHSCTLDGRKYYTLAGAGGQRTVILDDNILCNSNDPYHGTNNILVHEFAHTIKNYGLSSAQKSQVNAAYNYAKQYRLWADYYPMSTVEEYWAVGSSVYFATDHQMYRGTGNHLDLCNGNNFCTTEAAARYHIYSVDPNLYNILTTVYVSSDSTRYVNIGVCATP